VTWSESATAVLDRSRRPGGRFHVDPWDPGFGAALTESGGGLEETTADLGLDFEMPTDRWQPIDPFPDRWVPSTVLVVDGVRRIDARVWIEDPASPVPAMGLAASWAAGVVRLDGTAELVSAQVERGLFTACPVAADVTTRYCAYRVRIATSGAPDKLSLALQQRLAETEVAVALAARAAVGTVSSAGRDDLLVVDGPLRGRTHLPNAIGYIKTHHTAYLPPPQNEVVSALAPGQRTPVFTMGTSWSRHAWYLRLPVESQVPWAGVVRCECTSDLRRDDAVALANAAAVLLPRLASVPHKDPRAPQNLIPIGGLEKVLRHRLGDSKVLHRALVGASVSAGR
jgi:hypothetical protein